MAGAMTTTSGLVRMKVAVLRHSLHGARLERLSWGLMFGLAAVAATIWLSTTSAAADLLALMFGLWGVGWALGPVLFTGEDSTLRPEHFRTLPLTTRQLALGLLGASFVGAPAVISAAAAISLVVLGSRLSPAAVVTAVPALLLQVAFFVVLSRVVTSVLRAVIRSQLSAAISGLLIGAVMAFFISGWSVFAAVGDLFATGLPARAATVARLLPTGWALVAVEAAGSGSWMTAAAALLGLAVLVLLGVLLWSVLLRRRLTTRRARVGVRRSAAPVPSSPLWAVVRKELLTWRRDYTRTSFLYFAFFYSLFIGLYPIVAGSRLWLLLIGVTFAVTAAGCTANLYGADGSALWLTLTRPRATSVDVRGRQTAWLLVVGPVAVAATLIPIEATGLWWALPGSLTLVITALGAGAGLVVLHSVYQLIPMTDPHKRGDDMFDHEISWLQFMTMLVAIAVLVLPPFALVILGQRDGYGWAQWLAIPVALAFAALYFTAFGRWAYRRLAARGPELLQFMLHGPAARTERTQAKAFDLVVKAMTPAQRAAFYAAGFAGVIALFPQGVMPIIFKLTEAESKAWFLALYLPDAWQWPAAALMVAIGLVCLAFTMRIFLTSREDLAAGETLPTAASHERHAV
jgi:ABC-2 type transport system permease protein